MIHLTGELDTVADNGFVTDVAKVRGAATASSVAAANLKLDGIEEGALAADSVTDIANARASAAVGAIPLATTLVNGLATNTQITKLDGIPSDAQSALQVSAIASNVATGLFSTEAVLAWYLANWAVTDWYLDSVAGNDDNDGSTSGTALATAEELSRRLAIALPIAHPVTVHVAQGTYGTLLLQASLVGEATRISFFGTAITELSTTVASYTTYSHVTRSATHVTLTNVADLTPYIGRRIRRLSDNSVSFIGAVNHESLGVSVASIAPPYSIATGLTVVWTAADAVVIETLPTLQIVQGQVFASRTSEQCLRFESLNIKGSYSVEIAGYQYSNYLVGCSLACACSGHFANSANAVGCFFDPFPGKGLDCGMVFTNSVIGASALMPVNCRGLTRTIVLRSGYTPPPTIPVTISDCQFFDSTRVAVEPPQGSIVALTTGFSCSNVYCAFRIGYNTRIKYLSTLVVGIAYTNAGSVLLRQDDGSRTNPFYLSGTTAQVWEALTDYQDGYQKGQATIGVGGFIDVVCKNPTDFTLQQVRVSCLSTTTLQPYAPLAERISYQHPPVLSMGTFRIYGEVGKVVEWEISKTEHNIYFSNY
jgi:hypothetical protein